jgi:iron complex outermembrane receptor protein
MYVTAKMKLSTLSMAMLLATTGYSVQAAEEATAEQEKN